MMGEILIGADEIRTQFAQAMSAMYRAEVPHYGTLVDLVARINAELLQAQPALAAQMRAAGELDRLDVERHGAIRVGTPQELAVMRRLFAVMGMEPVGYYDLSTAGVPVHSTAFRPVDEQALRRNPFRVFTSLLRLELIDDAALRNKAAATLAARAIYTPRALALIERAEQQGGLNAADAAEFVAEALETFRWHGEATVGIADYRALHDAHRLIADVVCFKGPHINHLTPRTLDIDAVQAAMPEQGITPKETIEGPPRRANPILLRQTSFKALEEAIAFDGTTGTHTARFGEIEQRGVALTPKGRALYDRLLAETRANSTGATYAEVLARTFAAFPDDATTLRREGLAFYRYRPTASGLAVAGSATLPADLESLIGAGLVTADPIIYEDFLPVSAAGIFQSNLGEGGPRAYTAQANRAAFEAALGAPVTDELTLYAQTERRSIAATLAALGLSAAS
jgi:uncharacterized glyoxalase superfamily metalloenzyme YdcJ